MDFIRASSRRQFGVIWQSFGRQFGGQTGAIWRSYGCDKSKHTVGEGFGKRSGNGSARGLGRGLGRVWEESGSNQNHWNLYHKQVKDF